MLKRSIDIILSLLAGLVFLLPCILVAILVKATSKGPVLFWSDRVGRDNAIFKMPKFRSMRTDTPNVATHQLTQPEVYITPVGKFIRKTSLDELPQVWSILVGDMSIVGPRPALFNQDDLIKLRTEAGVHKLRPGLTGLAQVRGRDDLSIEEKVAMDREYLEQQSLWLDIKIILMTLPVITSRTGIRH
ncbi:sugar transferase [Rhizobium terricola]|uniref:sugar transferase n=1 Tax=Rhizobium terricola TaxID=2728849 RepID=UPI00197CE1EE|nr:sugar transferase [Rhizobium terricola]